MDGKLRLGLVPKERGWMDGDGRRGGGGIGVAEERKLELRLGPPGDDWAAVEEKREGYPVGPGLSLGYFDGKPCSPSTPPLPPQHASGSKTAANNNSHTRIASTPVVGWPPIRSFRRNIATSSKPTLESEKGSLELARKSEHGGKGLFVKINMDGIPIGRKLDLKVYDSYEKLPLAVDELFQGLIAAQRDPHSSGSQRSAEGKQAMAGLLDGTDEYTLVYEDDEGDRMLVGDVPWDMFVSTVKRLRVLKRSELSALSLVAVSRKRAATESQVASKELGALHS